MMKAQFSMEALMTWGWAIIFLTSAIGALFYFGVFNMTDLLPGKCELTPGLACDDYHVGKNTITIKVSNTIGKKIIITEFQSMSEHDVSCTSAGGPWPIRNGETSGEITCSSPDNVEGEKIKFYITLRYEFEDDPGQTYTAKGLIFQEVNG